MSRWDKTVTLLAPAERFQDSAGAWHEGERTGREVFCNEMTMSLVAMAQLRSADVRANSSTSPLDMGLRHEHMIQVRNVDYEGEDQVIFEGEEYEVLYLAGSGEYRTLTIGQRLGNDIVTNSIGGDGG